MSTLIALLILINSVPVFAEMHLPDFNLDTMTLSDFITLHGDVTIHIPPPVRADIGPSRPSCARGKHLLYGHPSNSCIRVESAVQIAVTETRTRADIRLPEIEFENKLPYDRIVIFINAEDKTPPGHISLVGIICSGRSYLGYSGISLSLPDKSGDFSLSDNLSLGKGKVSVTVTHPWITAGLYTETSPGLNGLCFWPYQVTMSRYDIGSLPHKINGFKLNYDKTRNTLNMSRQNIK